MLKRGFEEKPLFVNSSSHNPQKILFTDFIIKNQGGNMNVTQINNTTNFGMAIKLDKSANAIIKRQTYRASETRYENFWNELNRLVEDQEHNPVDIVIRKCKNRKALAADVFDNSEEPLNTVTFTQRLLKPFGLKFLKKAIKSANNINDINKKLDKLPKYDANIAAEAIE